MSKGTLRTLIEMSLVLVILFAANALHMGNILLLGGIVYITLNLYWSRQDALAELESSDAQKSVRQNLPLGKSVYVQICVIGILSSIAVAYVNGELARGGFFELALVGLPYFIPLGSIILGSLSTVGCMLPLRLLGRQPNSTVFYLFCVIGIVSSCSVYWSHYGGSVFWGDYPTGSPNTEVSGIGLTRSLDYSAFAGPAPWQAITPVLQLAGSILGATLHLLVWYPTCVPWFRSRRG